jgi:hypothetical protein
MTGDAHDVQRLLVVQRHDWIPAFAGMTGDARDVQRLLIVQRHEWIPAPRG